MTEAINQDDEALALSALIWILGDQARADRLLALTGLDADALRSGLGERAMQVAVLDFLCGHEADLVNCAADIDSTPQALVRAREHLSGERINR